MHFDTALNLSWLVIGMLAFAAVVLTTRRRTGSRIAAAALIIAALLFPFISATDDVVRIEHWRGQATHSNSQRGPNDDLVRLYQTMDTPLVCTVLGVSLTLFFVLFVWAGAVQRLDRSAPSESGRSPPALASVSI